MKAATVAPSASLAATVLGKCMPPHTRALFPSARACAMLEYVRAGCPLVVNVKAWPSSKYRRSTVAAAPF